MAHSTAHLNPSATSASGGQLMGLKAHGAHGDVDAGGCQLALYLFSAIAKADFVAHVNCIQDLLHLFSIKGRRFAFSARKLLGFDLPSGIDGQNTFLGQPEAQVLRQGDFTLGFALLQFDKDSVHYRLTSYSPLANSSQYHA